MTKLETQREKNQRREVEIASLELLAWFDEEFINGNMNNKRYRFLTKQVDILIKSNCIINTIKIKKKNL